MSPVFRLLALSALLCGCSTTNSPLVDTAVRVSYHYDYRSREFVEIEITNGAVVVDDREIPWEQFNLKNFGTQPRHIAWVPVLFVWNVPANGDLSAFTEYALRLVDIANRSERLYRVAILSESATWEVLQTSRIELETHRKIYVSADQCRVDGKLMDQEQLLNSLEAKTAAPLAVSFSRKYLYNREGYGYLHLLLRKLNRVGPDGRPSDYSFTVE